MVVCIANQTDTYSVVFLSLELGLSLVLWAAVVLDWRKARIALSDQDRHRFYHRDYTLALVFSSLVCRLGAVGLDFSCANPKVAGVCNKPCTIVRSLFSEFGTVLLALMFLYVAFYWMELLKVFKPDMTGLSEYKHRFYFLATLFAGGSIAMRIAQADSKVYNGQNVIGDQTLEFIWSAWRGLWLLGIGVASLNGVQKLLEQLGKAGPMDIHFRIVRCLRNLSLLATFGMVVGGALVVVAQYGQARVQGWYPQINFCLRVCEYTLQLGILYLTPGRVNTSRFRWFLGNCCNERSSHLVELN